MPQIQDCKRELREILAAGEQTSETHIVVSAGDLHRRVFGVRAEIAPVCAAAMRSELRDGDSIVDPSYDSASFTVRYALPRPMPVVLGDAQD
jgi:hypothetical protein